MNHFRQLKVSEAQFSPFWLKTLLWSMVSFALCAFPFSFAVAASTSASNTASTPRAGETVPAQLEKMVVIVSIPPLIQLARSVLPEGTEVRSFVPSGASPETFEPTPSGVMSAGKAQFFFSSEVPFEKVWLPKLSQAHPRLVVVSLFEKADGGVSPSEKSARHLKGSHHHHNHHHEHDPHLWVSPPQLKAAARIMAAAVQNQLSEKAKAEVALRLENVLAELTKLDSEIEKILKPYSKMEFFIFHPAWGSFAERFQLNQVALEKDGHSPTPGLMKSFLESIKKSRSKVVYAQPQMSRKEADAAARSVAGKVVMVDPLSENLNDELLKFAELLRADFESRK